MGAASGPHPRDCRWCCSESVYHRTRRHHRWYWEHVLCGSVQAVSVPSEERELHLCSCVSDSHGMSKLVHMIRTDALLITSSTIFHNTLQTLCFGLQPKSTGEPKTKPTQSSVRELRGLGLSPDLILCRSEKPINHTVKEKISNFCHVGPEQVSIHSYWWLQDLGKSNVLCLMWHKFRGGGESVNIRWKTTWEWYWKLYVWTLLRKNLGDPHTHFWVISN